MKKLHNNKKGINIDFIYMIIFLVIVALFFIIGKVVFNSINTNIQASPSFSNSSKQAISGINDRYVNIFDGLFLVILVGIYIFLLVSVYNLDTSPVYLVMAIIFLGIAFFLGGIMNNVFYDFASSSALSSTANSFSIIPYIFDNLMAILLFIAVSIMVVLYAKN